jgi:hypothetical protein
VEKAIHRIKEYLYESLEASTKRRQEEENKLICLFFSLLAICAYHFWRLETEKNTDINKMDL